jgi:hypothetical protein
MDEVKWVRPAPSDDAAIALVERVIRETEALGVEVLGHEHLSTGEQVSELPKEGR